MARGSVSRLDEDRDDRVVLGTLADLRHELLGVVEVRLRVEDREVERVHLEHAQRLAPPRYAHDLVTVSPELGREQLALLVEGLVIIECKAATEDNLVFEAQTLTYLRLLDLKLGFASTVPSATIAPPCRPAPGPRSMT